MNVPSLNHFLSAPKINSQRRPSIDESDVAYTSRLFQYGLGATIASNSKIKAVNSVSSSEIITTKISFQETLQLLHYCRLLFKTR